MTSKQAKGSKKAVCLLAHGDIQKHCTITGYGPLKSIIYSFQEVFLENFPAYSPGFVMNSATILSDKTFFKYSMWAKIVISFTWGVYSMETILFERPTIRICKIVGELVENKVLKKIGK